MVTVAIMVYRDRTVVFANPAMVTTLAYANSEELVGKDLLELHMDMKREAHEKGDRVSITMSGKFLPYRTY